MLFFIFFFLSFVVCSCFFVGLLHAFAKYSSLFLLVVFLYNFRFLSSVFLSLLGSFVFSLFKGYSHSVIMAYKQSLWLEVQGQLIITGQQATSMPQRPPFYPFFLLCPIEACVPGQRPFQRTLRTSDAESILKGTDPLKLNTFLFRQLFVSWSRFSVDLLKFMEVFPADLIVWLFTLVTSLGI